MITNNKKNLSCVSNNSSTQKKLHNRTWGSSSRYFIKKEDWTNYLQKYTSRFFDDLVVFIIKQISYDDNFDTIDKSQQFARVVSSDAVRFAITFIVNFIQTCFNKKYIVQNNKLIRRSRFIEAKLEKKPHEPHISTQQESRSVMN